MENEIVMKFEGLENNKGAGEKILRRIQKMPGIEFASVDEQNGIVKIIGGDIDRLAIEDGVESLGYPLVR